MCGDENSLTCTNGGSNRIAPIREKTVDGVFQTFGTRQLLVPEICVAPVLTWEAEVRWFKSRWPNVIAATPDLDLVLPVLCRRLCLIQSLQSSVMSLVKSPRSVHRNPHQIHLIEDNLQSANRPFEHRSKSHIK